MATVMKHLARQFHRPHGWLGVVAGLFMHRRNADRNKMLVGLAELEPGDRVLDVGCGSGTAVAAAAAVGGDGVQATGIDVSSTMVRLAARFHRRPVRAGRAQFREGAAETLPFADASFTVAWSMNSYHHWSDEKAGLQELNRILAPGGRVLICESLPNPDRRFGPPGLSGEAVGHLREQLESAAFTDIAAERHSVGGEPYVVVRGRKPSH
jgi:ubiquinone/menaquinone biosynthesis C-methylase UbiE